VNALPDLEKPRPQRGWVETRARAHRLKIRVVFKQNDCASGRARNDPLRQSSTAITTTAVHNRRSEIQSSVTPSCSRILAPPFVPFESITLPPSASRLSFAVFSPLTTDKCTWRTNRTGISSTKASGSDRGGGTLAEVHRRTPVSYSYNAHNAEGGLLLLNDGNSKNLAQFSSERHKRERLLQQYCVVLENPVMHHRLIRIPRHVNNLDPRPNLANTLR
jgi:hypothetical protein